MTFNSDPPASTSIPLRGPLCQHVWFVWCRGWSQGLHAYEPITMPTQLQSNILENFLFWPSGPEKGTEMNQPNRCTPAPQADRAAVFPLSHSRFLLGFLPSCLRDRHCPTRLEGCSFPSTAAETSLAVFFYKSLTALHTVAWAALFKAHCDCFSSFPWLVCRFKGRPTP